MAIVANGTLVVLSLLMGFRLIAQYAARSRQHTLWYGIGLLLIATAALPELIAAVVGPIPTLLWWLYWSSASSAVGFLAVGTAFLNGDRVGKVALVVMVLLSLWVVGATVATAGSGPAEGAVAAFAKAPTDQIKLPFLLQNIAGSLMILVGAVWSFVRTRALYNIWIALGTLIFASGGTSSGLAGFSEVFYFTQTAGILLLFGGVYSSVKARKATVSLRA